MATYGNFTGIATDGTYIYVCAEETATANQYLLQLDLSGNVVNEFDATGYNFTGICCLNPAEFYLCDTNSMGQIIYFDGSTFSPFVTLLNATPNDITSDGTYLYVALGDPSVMKITLASPGTRPRIVDDSDGIFAASYISYGGGELTLSDISGSKIYLVGVTGGVSLSRTFPTNTRPRGVFALDNPDVYFFNTATYFGYVQEGAGQEIYIAGSTGGATGYQDNTSPAPILFNVLTYMTNIGGGPVGPGDSYVVDAGNAAIRRISNIGPNPTVSTFYGGAGGGGGGGGGAPCFLGGSEILCLVDDKEVYVPVEQLKKGTLVKTSLDGYKKVEAVGKKGLWNTQTPERIQQRLYKLSPANYPELTKDLFLTGCHSILVDELTDLQRQRSIDELERIFVTDRKYRLIACVDERAEPWQSEGSYVVWHFALESENDRINYGVYANGGLLVETCSINFLQNRSSMQII
jgi:hypothetical protein